jgi:predicted PurR-regulated permease PerM
MNRDYINNGTLLALVILISVIFLVMIRSFLMPLFMAGLFSAMARPAYLWLNDRLGGRKMLAPRCLPLWGSSSLFSPP